MSSNKPGSKLSYLGFLVFKGFAWLINKTPFRVMYALSDFLYLLLYHVVGYRKKVVFQNLKNAFPGESPETLERNRRKFFRQLTDVILEVLKLPGMGDVQLNKRCHIRNPEVANALIDKGKNILFISGHSGNFEWVAQELILTFKGRDHYNGIVKPLSNPYFEDFMCKTIRQSRHPDTTVHFKRAFRTLISQRDASSLTYIVADQIPHRDEITYWTRFLNQDTAFFLGTEKMAKALDLPVIFMHILKPRRGFYEIDMELISADPKQTAEFEITEKHVHLLESDIIRQPETWLWSHRRWKYKKEDLAPKHPSN